MKKYLKGLSLILWKMYIYLAINLLLMKSLNFIVDNLKLCNSNKTYFLCEYMIWGGMDKKLSFLSQIRLWLLQVLWLTHDHPWISYLDLLPLCFYRLPQFLPRDPSSKSATENLPHIKSLTPLVSDSRFRFY